MQSEWRVVAKELVSKQTEEIGNREKKHGSISQLTKQQQTCIESNKALQAVPVIDGWFKSVL